MACPECGCKTNNGVCSNCQEELYIIENQGEFIDNLSQEFLVTAKEQERFLKEHKRRPLQKILLNPQN